MTDVLQQALGNIDGGQVLDVATGQGAFVGILKRRLKSYTEIVGIDDYKKAIEAARNSFGERDIRFIRMDAERMGFKDQCFDLVCAAKTLHHLVNVSRVLSEMMRVLKPGGRFIVSDMYREAQTEAQRTDVYIHHWAAEVHTSLGFVHYKTFTRRELVALIERVGLANLVCYDQLNTDSDPMDAEAIGEKQEIIDRVCQRASQVPDYQAFQQRAEELRQRLCDVGVQSEPVLMIVGEKR